MTLGGDIGIRLVCHTHPRAGEGRATCIVHTGHSLSTKRGLLHDRIRQHFTLHKQRDYQCPTNVRYRSQGAKQLRPRLRVPKGDVVVVAAGGHTPVL